MRTLKRVNHQKLAPYVFALPFVLSFLIFFAYPIAHSLVMSFQEVVPGETKFIGLENYQKLWNADFRKALYNNTRYTFWTLVILIPLPMVLAVLLNSKRMPFRNFFKSVLFVPALTSVVVAGIVFRQLFGELDGAPMNVLMRWLGLPSQQWLQSSALGMFALVTLASWRWMGVNILYYLSALQTVPRELYEAAEIDGAGPVRKFFNITIPLLKPVTIYVLTISIYGGYAMFTESYILWGGRQSPQGIGLTIVGYLYQQGFEYFNFGVGAAIGIVLLLLVLFVNLIQLSLFGLFKRED